MYRPGKHKKSKMKYLTNGNKTYARLGSKFPHQFFTPRTVRTGANLTLMKGMVYILEPNDQFLSENFRKK